LQEGNAYMRKKKSKGLPTPPQKSTRLQIRQRIKSKEEKEEKKQEEKENKSTGRFATNLLRFHRWFLS